MSDGANQSQGGTPEPGEPPPQGASAHRDIATESVQSTVAEETDYRPVVTNVMSGKDAPVSKVLQWMGCEVHDFDWKIDKADDLNLPDVRDRPDACIDRSDVLMSGLDCSTFTRALGRRWSHLPDGGPPVLRSDEHPEGLPESAQ